MGRPEADWARRNAMMTLGNGLGQVDAHEERLEVLEALLATDMRLGAPEENVLCVKNNISNCHADLGRKDEALEIQREIYDRKCLLGSEHNESTLVSAANLAVSLHAFHRFAECRSFALERIVDAERVLGAEHNLTVGFRKIYAVALCSNPEATQSDTQLAIETLEGCVRMSRRVMGKTHPRTLEAERLLGRAREQLAAYGD